MPFDELFCLSWSDLIYKGLNILFLKRLFDYGSYIYLLECIIYNKYMLFQIVYEEVVGSVSEYSASSYVLHE